MNEADALMANAHERLDSACILYENQKFADSVSRAYYSMFSAARALLVLKDIHPRTHRGLISQFSLEIVKKEKFPRELFEILTRAQEDREKLIMGLRWI